MSSWFLSDIHLSDTFERNGNTLLRFLFFLNQNPRAHRLFLLGDIFDVWVSDGSAFQKQFRLIVDEIKKFKKAGGEVFYFEGNHDFHVDVFWTKRLGIPVIEDVHYMQLEGLNVRMEHGDFISDDKAYLRYRAFVRHRVVESLGHLLPSYFWMWLGTKQSRHSRKSSSRYAAQNRERIINLIRLYAEMSHVRKPFDLIVTGHMHIFDDYEFSAGGKKVRSVNLGTWLEKARALKLDDGKAEVIDLEDFLKTGDSTFA